MISLTSLAMKASDITERMYFAEVFQCQSVTAEGTNVSHSRYFMTDLGVNVR